MCVGSSPVTSEMISARTGAPVAAARRPPWIAERCLRTVFISWIAAPLFSSCDVTRLRSAGKSLYGLRVFGGNGSFVLSGALIGREFVERIVHCGFRWNCRGTEVQVRARCRGNN